MQWFANRGQILQLGVALVAAIVALMVWLAVPPQSLLYAAPVAFLIFFGWAIWTAAKWHTLLHLPVSKTQPAASPTVPSTVPSPPAPQSATPKNEPTIPFPIIRRLSCAVGDVWESHHDHASFFTLKIIVHGISENTTKKLPPLGSQSDYVADIQLTEGGIIFYAGEQVKIILPNRFLLPVVANPFIAEDCSLHSYNFTENYVNFFALYVHHINPAAKTVSMYFCRLRGTRLDT